MSPGPITDALVLVTGASGFIASHIVDQLLQRGYRVRGTVRDPERARAEGHLTGLTGAAERLELVGADLMEDHAFDDPVTNCDYVIHTASPYAIDVADPQRDLVEPAVKGTLSCLDACLATPTVKRLVLTSSVAAITDEANGHVLTEDDWNTKSTLSRNPYYYSKTVAERAAWSAMESGHPHFDLVVINPFFVIGPSLVPSLNTSHIFLTGLTNGRIPGVLAVEWPIVDVRDVAMAHVLAMESPTAQGRYIVAAGTRSLREVIDLLRAHGWGDRYRLPSLGLDRGLGVPLSRFFANFQPSGSRSYLKATLGGRQRFDNSKAKRDLGLQYRDLDRTLLDTMEDLERWGHLGRKREGRF